MVEAAYASFDHAAVTPLVQLDDNLFFLELFHGPTLAFKDVAMQLLARMMDHVLAERDQRLTIVGATSGDTGAAAIEAFKGRDNIDVFILYPHNRVSDVQRRQMTTAPEVNIHVIALEGTFDDAQAILKALFNDKVFRDEVGLSGVNSINWARVAGADRLLFHERRCAWRPAPERLICRADRQFRRHTCRLHRQAHGSADRAADHRHQRERHSQAHARDRASMKCAA